MRIEPIQSFIFSLPPEGVDPVEVLRLPLDQDACRSGAVHLDGEQLYVSFAESACYPFTTLFRVDLETEELLPIKALESYRSHCTDGIVVTDRAIYELRGDAIDEIPLPIRRTHVIEGIERTGTKLVVRTKHNTRLAGEHHAEIIIVDLDSRHSSQVYREDHTLYDALMLDENRMLLSYLLEGERASKIALWDKEARTKRIVEIDKDFGKLTHLIAWEENLVVAASENRAPGIVVMDLGFKQERLRISIPEQAILNTERLDEERLAVVHQHRNTPSHQGLMLSVVNVVTGEIESETKISEAVCSHASKPCIDLESRRIAFVGYEPLHYSEEAVHVIHF